MRDVDAFADLSLPAAPRPAGAAVRGLLLHFGFGKVILRSVVDFAPLRRVRFGVRLPCAQSLIVACAFIDCMLCSQWHRESAGCTRSESCSVSPPPDGENGPRDLVSGLLRVSRRRASSGALLLRGPSFVLLRARVGLGHGPLGKWVEMARKAGLYWLARFSRCGLRCAPH